MNIAPRLQHSNAGCPTWIRLLVGIGFAVVLSWMVPRPAQGAIVDRVVAQVDDEIITTYEVEQAAIPYLMRQGLSKSELEDPSRRQEIYRKVLDQLVNRELVEKKARANDLSVSQQQVDRALSLVRRRQQLDEEQFRNLIESYGISYETYRKSVRYNLLKKRLVKQQLGRQISISPEEVEQAYREEYGEPQEVERQITLRQILFQPDSDDQAEVEEARKRAEAVLEKLESGEDFKALAREHSDGPSASDRGLLGTFTRGELNPAFRDTAFDLETGEYSKVVRTKFGFHLFRVDSVTTQANDQIKKRRKRIRQTLRQQKIKDQVDIYLDKLRRETFVDIKIEDGTFG